MCCYTGDVIAERNTDRSELFEVGLDVSGGRRRRQTTHEHLLGPRHQLHTTPSVMTVIYRVSQKRNEPDSLSSEYQSIKQCFYFRN